jgi:hypothetical protein
MKTEQINLNDVCVTFDDRDDVLLGAQYAVTEAQHDQNCWNVYLTMTPEQWGSVRISLQELGFVPAGFLSADAKTRVKVKKNIKKSSDGGTENFGNKIDDRDTSALQEFVRLHPEYAVVYEKFCDKF